MKFKKLEIANLRAIHSVCFEGLEDLVLIAGPNGVGKSCVLDGIRLLKSAYAGYQANEFTNWFNEFQINPRRRDASFQRIFRDPSKPLRVSAVVELAEQEKQFLRANATDLLRSLHWRTVSPNTNDIDEANASSLASELRTQAPSVEKKIQRDMPGFIKLLEQPTQTAEIVLRLKGRDTYQQNLVLEVIWGTFDPENIGIIDFHGAHRSYGYEKLNNINLDIKNTDERVKQHALYQTQNKYSNIKSEMAAAFVRDLISEKAGKSHMEGPSIIDTLKDLFIRFFPGKEFVGPVPAADGSLSFPVKLNTDGSTHDVNFLSSGEKEVLFGYLRLRNSAPKNSVILIDEPELHLNPRLVKGLPNFYHENIGKALDNQVWLVTHSDAFLRDARGIPGASIWHMREWDKESSTTNQATAVSQESDVERAVIDLVGDIAGYRPGAQVLIVEGSDSEFDEDMITRLFPEIAAKVNIISAGSRTRVEKLQDVLSRATQSVGWEARFSSITDHDIDPTHSAASGIPIGSQNWDVYHIENYLLVPEYILYVLDDLRLTRTKLKDERAISSELRKAAEQTIDEMVKIHMHNEVHRKVQAALTLRLRQNNNSIALSFSSAINETQENVRHLLSTELNESYLRRKEITLRQDHAESLANGTWTSSFRGRNILQRFVDTHAPGRYQEVRNLIVSRMRDRGYQPEGMRIVLEKALRH